MPVTVWAVTSNDGTRSRCAVATRSKAGSLRPTPHRRCRTNGGRGHGLRETHRRDPEGLLGKNRFPGIRVTGCPHASPLCRLRPAPPAQAPGRARTGTDLLLARLPSGHVPGPAPTRMEADRRDGAAGPLAARDAAPGRRHQRLGQRRGDAGDDRDRAEVRSLTGHRGASRLARVSAPTRRRSRRERGLRIPAADASAVLRPAQCRSTTGGQPPVPSQRPLPPWMRTRWAVRIRHSLVGGAVCTCRR